MLIWEFTPLIMNLWSIGQTRRTVKYRIKKHQNCVKIQEIKISAIVKPIWKPSETNKVDFLRSLLYS